ncbi:PREDICTED: uncharacterized protein LOC109583994 [Amphimedon queenslandica]|uniref:Ig-like domain-containing protein n=1 Tax=Amphimedon queenslandica TaxID=400682 RepID=A0AAN0JEC2_AMPQE|nr:PREDICTED: uncharacterized protein LOC109583994 [Amphimedon queenslandica]|eukprot:XP_019855107.1 PREDICTED: uncharacterized protein LOC109583994 [Amphimedon queenslandica]
MYSFSRVIGAVALFLCLLSVADSQFQITDLGTGEVITGDTYRINQGYQFRLICLGNINLNPIWVRNQTQVPSILDVSASSVTNTSELIEGLSASDFRQLFQSSTSVSSVISSFRNGSNLILPNSSIGGQYACQAANGQMQNLTIIVSTPSGSFSEFYVRMTGLISSASSVNDKDFDLAVFESRLSVSAVIAGLNASDDPIRTISCSFVPL